MRVISLRLPDQTVNALRATADIEGVTVSDVVRSAIESRVVGEGGASPTESPSIEDLLAGIEDIGDWLDVASG